MDVEGQLGKLIIDQFYNQNLKKFLHYRWVQNSIIQRYNLGTHKKGKFYPIPRNRNLLYTPIAYKKTRI